MDEFKESEAYQVAHARNRNTSVRVELLNDDFNVIDTLECDVVSGSINIQNALNSDLARRKGSLSLVSKKDLNTDFYKIALNNKVRIYLIIQDNVRTVQTRIQGSIPNVLNDAINELGKNGNLSSYTISKLKSYYPSTDFNKNVSFVLSSLKDKALNNFKYEPAKYEYNMGIFLLNSPNTKISITERTINLDLCDLIENYSTFSNGLVGKISFPKDSSFSDALRSIVTNKNLMGLTNYKLEATDFVIPSTLNFEQDTDLTEILKKLLKLHPTYDCYFDMNGYFVFETIQQRQTDMAIDYIDSTNDMIVSVDYKKNFENVRNDVVVLGSINKNSGDATKPIQAKYELKNSSGNELSIDKIGLRRKVVSDENFKTNEMCQSACTYYMDKYSNLAETLTIQFLPMPYLFSNRVIEINIDWEDVKITGRWLIDSVAYDLKSNGLQTVTCHKIYNQSMLIGN